MIIYSVEDGEEHPSLYGSKAEAVKEAKRLARHLDRGDHINIQRHTTGPLTKRLFIDAVSVRGWSRGYTVVASIPTTGEPED